MDVPTSSWTLLARRDRRQRTRIRRMPIVPVLGGSLAFALLVAWTGYLEFRYLAWFGAASAVLIAAFYAVVRSGWNLRFSDPDLAVPQLFAAGLAISYLAYFGQDARPGFVAMYLLAILFGVLWLDLRRLLLVATFYLACYVGVVMTSLRLQPGGDERRELFRIVAAAIIFAGFAFIGGYISRLRRDLEVVNARLLASLDQAQALARIDVLTGCYNRRHGLELLEVECARTVGREPLSVALADIDHFKAINDEAGHAAGDAVLRGFAEAVQRVLRGTDFLVRWGGEEFLVVFPDTPLAGARSVAERIRKAAAEIVVPSADSGRRLGVSIGLAEHARGASAEATVAKADQALYRAKNEGRDRVVDAER